MNTRGQEAIAQTPSLLTPSRETVSRDADDRASRELVGYRAVLRQVDVPPLIVVADHLGLYGELREQRVHAGHGLLIGTACRGNEDGVELVPQVLEHG